MKLFTSNKSTKADAFTFLQNSADAAATKEIKSLINNFKCDFDLDNSRIKFETSGGYIEIYCKNFKNSVHLNVGYNEDLLDTDADLVSSALAAVIRNNKKINDVLKRHAEFRNRVWDEDISEEDAKSLLFKLFRV